MSNAAELLPFPYVDQEESEVRQGWRIESAKQADWALQRLAELHLEMEEADALKAAAVERARVRHERLTAKISRGLEFFETQLEAWATTNRAELLTGKAKSKALLNGSVGWRSTPARLEVTDEAALLEWARTQGGALLKVKESPALTEIQKHHKQTGEVPPGTDVKPAGEAFVIKLETEEHF